MPSSLRIAERPLDPARPTQPPDAAASPRLWLTVTVVLALVAFWPLIGLEAGGGDGATPLPDAQDVEQLFFEPHQSAPGLIVMIAAGLFALRARRFLALAPSGRPVAAGLAFASALAIAVWSRLVAADDLLVLSLIACASGFALATRGWSGLRLIGPVLAALCFAIPVPGRVANAVIWMLQIASTDGAEWLLRIVDLPVHRDGVFMQRGDQGFLVIESCSGFRSLQILTLLAIVVGELLELRRRTLWLVVLAPLVAFALNVLRITWIVFDGQDTATASEHVGQGMTVLLVGVAALFGLARLLSPPGANRGEGHGLPEADGAEAAAAPIRRRDWRGLAGALTLLALVVHATPAWPVPSLSVPPLEDLFRDRAGWTKEEDLQIDRIFLGSIGVGRIVSRRLHYEGTVQAAPGPVEIFAALDSRSQPRSSPVSDRLLLPAREWGIEAVEARRDWRLFQDTQEAIVRRGSSRMLVRLWYVNDPGPVRDDLRSVFALTRGPVAPDRSRGVLRLATPLTGTGPVALDHARGRLDQFVVDYRADLDRVVP